jgi:integrase/recombinase XerD
MMDKQVPIDLYSITYNDIKHHFIGGMLEQKLASNMINQIKSCKVFFAFLYRENLIQNNLAEHFALVKSEKKMISTFSKHQIINLLEQPGGNTFVGLRDYTMMLILLETRLRLNELLNLRIDDIRWADNEIYVYQR